MSNSRENPPITEKQKEKMKELLDKRSGKGLTDQQALELAGLIAKEENSKNVVLSDTCIGYLTEAYAWEVWGKFNVTKEMDIEYITKGREVEDESIELLSFVKNRVYEKNTERIENDFLSGHPDVYAGEALQDCQYLTDMKNCWSLPGFLDKIAKEKGEEHREQIAGYGLITGCANLSVTYALVNTPESIRNGYKFRLANKLNVIDVDHTEQWKQIERSMIFTDIPATQRIHEIPVQPFTQPEIEAIYDRVRHCREWLDKFHESYIKLNQ
jgi:hypothetical protein